MARARKDFKEDLKWNVKDLYQTEEDYEKDYHYIKEHLKDYIKYQGHILDSEDTLYEVLSFDYKMSEKLERIYVYAHINNDSDTTDVKYQTMFGKAYKLYEEYNEAIGNARARCTIRMGGRLYVWKQRKQGGASG